MTRHGDRGHTCRITETTVLIERLESDKIYTRVAQTFLTFFHPFTLMLFLGISVAVAVRCTNRLMLEISHLRRLSNGCATERLSRRTLRAVLEDTFSEKRNTYCYRLHLGGSCACSVKRGLEGRHDYAPSVSCVTSGEGCFRVFFGTRQITFGSGCVVSKLLAKRERGTQTRTNLLELACHWGVGPGGICGEKGARGENT